MRRHHDHLRWFAVQTPVRLPASRRETEGRHILLVEVPEARLTETIESWIDRGGTDFAILYADERAATSAAARKHRDVLECLTGGGADPNRRLRSSVFLTVDLCTRPLAYCQSSLALGGQYWPFDVAVVYDRHWSAAFRSEFALHRSLVTLHALLRPGTGQLVCSVVPVRSLLLDATIEFDPPVRSGRELRDWDAGYRRSSLQRQRRADGAETADDEDGGWQCVVHPSRLQQWACEVAGMRVESAWYTGDSTDECAEHAYLLLASTYTPQTYEWPMRSDPMRQHGHAAGYERAEAESRASRWENDTRRRRSDHGREEDRRRIDEREEDRRRIDEREEDRRRIDEREEDRRRYRRGDSRDFHGAERRRSLPSSPRRRDDDGRNKRRRTSPSPCRRFAGHQ